MSLEAIQKIQNVEEEMEKARVQTGRQAQEIVDQAEREGQALIAAGRQKSAQNALEAMEQAERKAAERREEILDAATQDCQKLSKDADAFMAQAVKLIVERVVER